MSSEMSTKLLLVKAARLPQRMTLKHSKPPAVHFSSPRAFRAEAEEEAEDADPDMVRSLGPVTHEFVANLCRMVAT